MFRKFKPNLGPKVPVYDEVQLHSPQPEERPKTPRGKTPILLPPQISEMGSPDANSVGSPAGHMIHRVIELKSTQPFSPIAQSIAGTDVGDKADDTAGELASMLQKRVQALRMKREQHKKDHSTMIRTRAPENMPSELGEKLSKSSERSKMKIKDFLLHWNVQDEIMTYRKHRQDNASNRDTASCVSMTSNDVGKTSQDIVNVPKVRIGSDGEIIVDEKSLVVESQMSPSYRAKLAAGEFAEETVYECGLGVSGIQRHNTTKRKPGRSGNILNITQQRTDMGPWSKVDTAKFLTALSLIGTDLSIIARFFPSRTYRQLSNRLRSLERTHPDLVTQAINRRMDFDPLILMSFRAEQLKEMHEKHNKKKHAPNSTRKRKLAYDEKPHQEDVECASEADKDCSSSLLQSGLTSDLPQSPATPLPDVETILPPVCSKRVREESVSSQISTVSQINPIAMVSRQASVTSNVKGSNAHDFKQLRFVDL